MLTLLSTIFWRLPPLRMREKLTLWYSYVGELGRGSFMALYPSFAMIVALSYFGVKSKYLLWCLASSVYVGMSALNMVVRSSCVYATICSPGATGFDKLYGRRVWVKLDGPEDVNQAFIKDLRKRRECAETAINDYLARRGKHP